MAESKIIPVEVAPKTFGRLWGVKVYDYKIGNEPVDFESLLVKLSCRRASIVEREIAPVSKVVTRRNAQLKQLGDALADLSRAQAKFTEKSAPDEKQQVSSTTVKIVSALTSEKIFDGTLVTKANCEMAIQLVKSKMEKHNNDSQNDTTRLQGLITKRDGAFDTASSLLKNVTDTRSNSIRNMISA